MGIRANSNEHAVYRCHAMLVSALFARHLLCTGRQGRPGGNTSRSGDARTVVTQQASFVLYVPKGWKAQELTNGQTIQVTARTPRGAPP